MTSTGGSPSAGWYADPSGAAAMRWWDGQSWTDHVALAPIGPAGGRAPQTGLARLAGLLLLPWCVLGAVLGVFGFVDASVRPAAWMGGHSWHSPVSSHESGVVFVLWLLSMSLLVPSVVVGVAATTRLGNHRIARAIALPILVLGGCVAEFVAPALNSGTAHPGSFVHGGRLAALVFTTVAVLVAVGSAKSLALLSRRPQLPANEQAPRNG